MIQSEQIERLVASHERLCYLLERLILALAETDEEDLPERPTYLDGSPVE